MENRTKRDISFLNVVTDFESDFENGNIKPYDLKTFLEIIRFYEEELQFEKALEVASMGIEQYSFRSDFYLIKARLLFQTNEHELAIELLNKAERISPYEHDILLLKIKILALQGQIEEAKNILNEMKSYLSSSDLSDMYLSESYIHEYLQEYDNMYETLTKAVVCDMSNEEALERIGFSVQLCKNFGQSIQFHKMVLDNQPYNYLAWYNLGQAQTCEGDYEEAILSFEYSFITQSDFENGYLDCADLCIQEKKYPQALDIYSQYVHRFSLNEEVLMNMAECEYQLDNLNESRILLNKLLKLDPYNDEVYFKLGLCYVKAEKWHKAINAFHKAIMLEDQCEDYYLHIARAQNAIGSYDEAENYFRKAVEVGPEQSLYWADYVTFLIKVGKNVEALAVLDQAEMYTYGADLTFAKGVATYHLGDKETAFSIIEEGLKDEYDLHPLIFSIDPELMLDKELQAMIKYYKEE